MAQKAKVQNAMNHNRQKEYLSKGIDRDRKSVV